MKLIFFLLVSASLGVAGYIAFDQISEHYRVVGAQEFARLQGKDKPASGATDCLKLSASVKGRFYRISAENICSRRTPETELLVKFYNKQSVRIGVTGGLPGTPAIALMDPGERMSHEFEIPADLWKQNTAPESAKAEVLTK